VKCKITAALLDDSREIIGYNLVRRQLKNNNRPTLVDLVHFGEEWVFFKYDKLTEP
jgi:hypothetical protein